METDYLPNPVVEYAGNDDEFYCQLRCPTFLKGVTRAAAALGAEGFNITSDIDVQALMKVRQNIAIPGYCVLHTSTGQPIGEPRVDLSAHKSPLLSFHVMVREEFGGTQAVAFIVPAFASSRSPDSDRALSLVDFRRRLARVRAALAALATTEQELPVAAAAPYDCPPNAPATTIGFPLLPGTGGCVPKARSTDRRRSP